MSACTVGPVYVRPDGPVSGSFIRRSMSTPEATVQTDPEFWRSFGDPLLERLVDRALLHNNDLRIAYANFQQANALLRGAKYDYLPTLTVDAEASSVRESADQDSGVDRAARDYHEYLGNLGFSWELDLFGRIRRGVEAQRADAAASAEDLAAMQIAVVGELAQTYFQLRGWQGQLRIAQENADNQDRTLQILRLRRDAGMATAFDVERGRTQSETTRSRIPALEAEVAVAAHRIAVLAGATPESLAPELEVPGELPSLPDRISVDAPSSLLRRRPDVAAAERRLAAATARIGVATADLFPRFTLSGMIGTQALNASALFKRDSETRLLGLGVSGSFLNVGQVRARIAAASAENAVELARYEKTVLEALEETESALVRLSRSAREADHLGVAAAAGVRAADMARLRFDHGAIDTLELLDAENARLQAEDAFSQGRVRNTLAAISLYRALAGGWPGQVPEESTAREYRTILNRSNSLAGSFH